MKSHSKKSGIIFIRMTQDRQSYSVTFITTDRPTIPMVPIWSEETC